MLPEQITLADGVRFLGARDERFKTARVTLSLLVPLSEETASVYAILPFLLRRSCAAYPDFTALNRRLNELYGARIMADVSRVGESQALMLVASSIDSRFALQGEDVAAHCAQLLCSMLFEPALENGLFRSLDVEQEKRCLAELIQSEINEKRWYARHQCEKLLCRGEAYAVSRYGTLEKVMALTPEKITCGWKQMLQHARIQLMVQGSGSGQGVADTFRREFESRGARQPVLCTIEQDFDLREPRTQVDRMDVNQSKLVMGFRTTVAEPQEQVAAMRLLNALWGGTPHSLLFRNVREKLSLCYYCQSSYDRHKGVLLVDSGVEESKAGQAQEEILRQLDAICRGDFTQEDLESARRSVVNQFLTVEDLPSTQASWYLGQAALDKLTTPAEAAEAVEKVTKEEVCAAAQTIRLGSVYMLAALQGKEDAGHAGKNGKANG